MLIPTYNRFAIQWFFDNCLMLNPDKTKLMVFGSRGMSSKLLDFYPPSGKDIHPAQSVKDLGVISDPTISFDNHICTVSSCLWKLSQISCIKFVFDKQLLETIINALFSVNYITVHQYGHLPQPVIFVNCYMFKTLPRELSAT